eukprot:3510683-Ditylum_brightwellii.AAC.1
MESLNQDSVIEDYLARKYTAPVGTSIEEIKRLNYFHVMQRALLLTSSGNASKEEMDAILNYARSNSIETDEIVRVFEMCSSENDTSEEKTDHAPLSSESDTWLDLPNMGLSETLTEDELDNAKPPATGKIRTLCHPHSGRTPYLRVHGDANHESDAIARDILNSFSMKTVSTRKSIKSFVTMDSLDQDSVIEDYLARKYTAPVGASIEEIKRLNYFNAMQRALLLTSSCNASKEEMDAILNYAR